MTCYYAQGNNRLRPLGRSNSKKKFRWLTVPQTDTGNQVEYTKVFEITMLKELGKLYV